MNVAAKHSRIQESLLSQPERRLLRWLVRRIPDWVMPDHLTALGVAGAALVPLGYGLSRVEPACLWLAVVGFVLNWFGDSLDGTLARHRKHERPRYGFFLDHTTDVVTEAMMFLGIGLSPCADFRLAACALISYLALSVLSYVNMIVSGEFRLSGGKIGPTEIRLIGIAATAGLYFFGAPVILTIPLIGAATWLDMVLAGVAVGLSALFVGVGGKLAAGLAQLEP